MSDLLSILEVISNIHLAFPIVKKKILVYDVNKYSNSLYLRFEVKDRPGVFIQLQNDLLLIKYQFKD